ncbi:VOC family protein [Sulfitobacter sp.]|uniref:VOC family protein n=1 Tax=Sulfitobacter sp. TaxID=1903071 RepID=UPI00300126D6
MKVRGLNHITLATRDLQRAIPFYRDTLGLVLAHEWPQGAYFTAGDLWFCLSLDERAQPSDSYTHFAFDVDPSDFDILSQHVRNSGVQIWKENRSEGASLYFCDPDGNRLELHVGSLTTRLDAMKKELALC